VVEAPKSLFRPLKASTTTYTLFAERLKAKRPDSNVVAAINH
jgi:hypothetical protein